MKNEMLALILAGGQGTRLFSNLIQLVKEIVGLKELAMLFSKISTISIASIRNMS